MDNKVKKLKEYNKDIFNISMFISAINRKASVFVNTAYVLDLLRHNKNIDNEVEIEKEDIENNRDNIQLLYNTKILLNSTLEANNIIECFSFLNNDKIFYNKVERGKIIETIKLNCILTIDKYNSDENKKIINYYVSNDIYTNYIISIKSLSLTINHLFNI